MLFVAIGPQMILPQGVHDHQKQIVRRPCLSTARNQERQGNQGDPKGLENRGGWEQVRARAEGLQWAVILAPAMPDDSAKQKRDHLESALLFLGRKPTVLARALALLLDPETAHELGRAPGSQRRGKPNPYQVAAKALIHNAKVRAALVGAILEDLPKAVSLPAGWLEQDEALHLKDEVLLATMAQNLLGEEMEDWERAQQQLESWGETLLDAKISELPSAMAKDAQQENVSPNPDSHPRVKKLEKESKELRRRLHAKDQKLAELQEKLGLKRQQVQLLQEEREDARNLAQEEHRRASATKKKLKSVSSASEREQQLETENEQWEHDLRIAREKMQILQRELDDLRSCFQDLEQFEEFAEEDVPSFRDRPLTTPEQELTQQLQNARKAGGKKFAILVIGGSHPQRRHVPKLEEYAEVLGFQSTWRMADYVSWHKEMDRLQTEMATKYDALVILHWNRTTFGRRARDICNKQGQKPCITCHYEGFVSLRKTLQTILKQLLNRALQGGV